MTTDVDRLRRLTDLWAAECNCGGPQPSLIDDKLSQHFVECPFAQIVRREIEESAMLDEQ